MTDSQETISCGYDITVQDFEDITSSDSESPSLLLGMTLAQHCMETINCLDLNTGKLKIICNMVSQSKFILAHVGMEELCRVVSSMFDQIHNKVM